MSEPQKSQPAAAGKMVIFTAESAPTLEETEMMDDPTYTEEGANDSPWPKEFSRARIEKERGTQDIWNSKYVRGGLVDIEFIAQYLQLRHAAANPDILSPDTCTALRRLGDATLLDPAAAADLIDALRLWQRLQAYLRLTVDGGFDRDAAPAALLDGLARVVSPEPAARLDPVDLEGHVRALADRAYGHFQAIVEAPAARLAGDD